MALRSRLLVAGVALPMLALAPGCGGGGEDGGADGEGPGSSQASGEDPGGGRPGSGTSSVGDPGEPPQATPSGYLHLTAERLEALTALVDAGDARWTEFQSYVDSRLGEDNLNQDSPENRALVYLMTRDPKYAEAAYRWVSDIIDTVPVDGGNGNYLELGNLMRHAAIVLSYCGEALDEAQQNKLVEYLDRYPDELWFGGKGTGWALADPGNNFHMGFLQGTAYAAYALAPYRPERAAAYQQLLHDKLTMEGGVFEYLEQRVSGGGWLEGVNYGERSKQRLYDALAVIASMGGTNYLYEHPFFADSVAYAIYELQPDLVSLHSGGDLPRVAAMPVTPADRDYLQTAGFWLGTGTAARLARWYLDHVATTYDAPSYRGFTYRDFLYPVEVEELAPDSLPTSYLAEGTGWINVRSGWGEGDTSLTISAPSVIEQSHQHIDVGSFVIFKRGWLALDAASLSSSGLNWSPGAHNLIHIPNAQYRTGPVVGLTAQSDDGELAYAQVDATDQYRYRPGSEPQQQLLAEHTRELVFMRPGTLVVYDRVVPHPAGNDYRWRLHLPGAPTESGAGYGVEHGGAGLTLVPIEGKVSAVTQDGDLPGGSSTSWRIEESPADAARGRFLNVIAVGDGGAPQPKATPLETRSELAGVVVDGTAFVFSAAPKGAPLRLPASYTVPEGADEHVIANIEQSVDVSVARESGGVTITLSPGSSHAPNEAKLIRFRL